MSTASPHGSMIDCETCTEHLADFLLDELPESEAVLIHEHLNLCAECLKRYKDLKGTGKALEAIPALRDIQPSSEFEETVRGKAKIESALIVAKLTPDRRLRYEVRRAARMSQRAPPKPPPSVWSPGLLLLALSGVVALLIILIWPRGGSQQHMPLGVLSTASGNVSQFYQRENEPYTPVKEGKIVLPGDAFSTTESGRARFEMDEGGAVFLGPVSDLTFRPPPPNADDFILVLDKGELGIQRHPQSVSVSPHSAKTHPLWEIRCEAATITLSSDAHVYLRVWTAPNKEALGELIVLHGRASATNRAGHSAVAVEAGSRAMLAAAKSAPEIEALPAARVPTWRAEIISESDLAGLLGVAVKLHGRSDGGFEVAAVYGKNCSRDDWSSEPAGAIGPEKGDLLNFLPHVRLRHALPLAAPLCMELSLNGDSPREASFAFGVLEFADSGVAVDVSHDALLQVVQNGRTLHRESIPARTQAGAPERLRLEISQEHGSMVATLRTASGKTKALPLPKEITNAAGEVWIKALGEGIQADELKITGVLPLEWIRERLSGL